MNGEHNTPLGTPVVIAPGKIPLVGEYAVLEEGSAVLAAVTRYAKAQFTTRGDPMSPMVSEVVRQTKAELGEVAAALPPGSVLVNTDDFQQGSERSGFGTSAAIAVAAVGAVFESLGLAIRGRKSQILAIADGARRAAQGNAGSGADLAAAAHGGLIKIVRRKDASPVVEPLAAPPGLQLVLFSASHSIPTGQVLEGVKQYATRDPIGYEQAMDHLREIAQRFVEELTAGSATGALVAAGRYGDRLAKMAAEASVPIMTDAFTLASELAQALGGIAKPTGAGGGAVGLALFATPEAALLFRRACPESLTCLDGHLDGLGVRCQVEEKVDEAVSEESGEQAGEKPGETDFESASAVATPAPVRDAVVIGARAEEAVTVRRPVAPDQEQEHAADAVPLDLRAECGSRKRAIRGAAIAGALALILVAWIAVPNPIRARIRNTNAAPARPAGTGLANKPSDPPPGAPTLPAGSVPAPGDADLPPARELPSAPSATTARPTPVHVVGPARRVAATKPAHADGANSPKTQATTRSPSGAAKAFVPRAGVLSPDDF
jgi:mevalonate kinase